MTDPFAADIVKIITTRPGPPGGSADAATLANHAARLAALEATQTQRAIGTGLWYGPRTTLVGYDTESPLTLVKDRLYAVPWSNHRSTGFDRVGIEVNTAVASAQLRMGLYAPDTAGNPAALVHDFGWVDASATGARELPIDVDIAAGFLWLACAASHAGVAVRAINVELGTTVVVGHIGIGSAFPISGVRRSTALTAGFTSLPGTFGLATAVPVQIPSIEVRIG